MEMTMSMLSRSSRVSAQRVRLLLVAAGLCVGGLMPGAAFAQTDVVPAVRVPLPEGLSDPSNAALLYGRALRMMSAEDLKQVRDAQTNAKSADGAEGQGQNAVSTERVDEILANNGGTIGMVVEASKLERCDWGIQYSKGPLALLDHAGPMRMLTHVLDAKAERLAAAGDMAGAAAHIAAVFNVAEHTSQDRIMISSLVSIAMAKVASNRVNLLLDAGSIDRAGARVILDSIRRLERARDFRMTEALRTESWMISQWMRRAYVGPEAGKLLVEGIDWMVEDSGDTLKGLSLLDERALAAHFDGIDRAYDALIGAWTEKDGKERIREVHDAVVRGEYGLIAQVFVPDFSKSRASVTEANEVLGALVKRLEQVK
jgi:hypothetical protein